MSEAQMAMSGVVLDYPNALIDSVITQQSVAQSSKASTAQPEPLGKCINPATGEPVSARRADEGVLPAPGSVKESADGNGTGTCPECSAHVKLSGKGFVTAHTVRKESIPAPPPTVRLAERQTAVTEMGVRVGSPDLAERSRTAELSGVRYGGWHAPLVLPVNGDTVVVQMRQPKVDAEGNPVLGKNGRPLTQSSMVRVPATEANVRTALRQEQRKRMRKDKTSGELVGGPDKALLVRLGRMLKGLTGTEAVGVLGAEPGTYQVREAVVMDAPNAPEGREERRREDGRTGHVLMSPGPALVTGRAMSGVVPGESDRVNSKGKPKNALGWEGGLGRPRADRMVLDGSTVSCVGDGCSIEGCPEIRGGRDGYMACHVYRIMSKTQKRRYRAQVATTRARRKAAEERARELAAPKGTRHAPGYGYVTGRRPSRAGIQMVTATVS